MKKLFFLSATFAVFSIGNAQVQKHYNVTKISGANYQQLGNTATQIPFATDWDDDLSDPITIPFQFKYQNTAISSVEIETEGSLYFNNTGMPSIMGIMMDYDSKNRGKVFYETTGNNGNRIFKVEYRNLGRYEDSTNNDTVNFQIWLYEADNAIEYHLGFNNVPNSSIAHNIAEMNNGLEPILTGLFGNEGDYISEDEDSLYLHTLSMLSGQFTDTAIFYNALSSNPLLYLNSIIYGDFPAQGTVFRFEPTGNNTGIKTIQKSIASIFPNPSEDGIFNIKIDKNITSATVKIYDVLGRKLMTKELNNINNTINLAHQAKGNYLCVIETKDQNESFTLIKK
ncbi:MAG TPA: T9SS type A sorting domain-containing protein [Edaphocola sp.]|nr:T9SS type A sorting domain-containing protein [Edaphocola sp.]